MSLLNSIMHFCLRVLLVGALPFLSARAQHLEGVVRDRQTGHPIRGTSIVVGQIRAATDAAGHFNLPSPTGFPLTVTATHVGYDPVSIKLYMPPDTLLQIFLSGKAIGLDEVTVLGRRNSVKDSLWMRREYADQFNFKPVKPWQAMTLSPVGIGINLNVLFASFSREQKQHKRLKAALFHDERQDYVDRRFTKALIQAQTNIPDAELDVFHWYFRPTYEQLLGFTEYDLLLYIQQHYKDFRARRNNYPKGIPALGEGQ
ncbi:CarboxypepD_reg-like domain-containing protein [Parapedobacter luteus]|uniref:CarboxypepD_reg-like domain-containing protein n=1 Tax=Parapedobacter luteus TaxID=623280 RepID=A0A1T5AMV4_9SPHI|nr:carboxypeptidase-like regulatory domain-containing protein [Parapedobacter luteus]SKB36159.1 CarboxypepD_reg-like domain-containing protein [Parapedobacter luteus]